MNLSILIVNWNTRDLLAQCLQSVYAYPPAVEFEVIVVDNGSADGSAGMVRERFTDVQLLENKTNLGFAAANNQALRKASGRFALLLNSDALLTDGALNAMISFLDAHPAAGAVGPKLINPDGSFQASFAMFPKIWSEIISLTGLSRIVIGPHAPSPNPLPNEAPRVVDWVAGASFMIRQMAYKSVGLLDEDYFFSGEEMDWCWRLRRGGWQVWYLPTVEVVHIGGASSSKVSSQTYLHLYKGKFRFFRIAYGKMIVGGLRLVTAIIVLLRLMVRVMTLPIYAFRSGQHSILKLKLDAALLRFTIFSR